MPPPPVDIAPTGPITAGSLSSCRLVFACYSLAWGSAALAVFMRAELTGIGTSDGVLAVLWLGVLLISLTSSSIGMLTKANRWASIDDRAPAAIEPRLRTFGTRMLWSVPVVAIGLVGTFGPWWSDDAALLLCFGLVNPAGHALGSLLAVLWIEHRRRRRVASQRLSRLTARYLFVKSSA